MSRKARKNVGLIGLGIIGSRVAAGLRAAGWQVYVWNRSARPAPNFLGSPAEVAGSAEIIQIFVADAGALFDVIEAMGDSLTARHTVICSATVGPEAVLEAAKLVELRGAQFLDAPFTGSKVAAEKRQLVYYVGGAEATFLRVRPVLEATSKAILRMGEIGHASTVKVVTNMISAVTAQVLAESLSIVQKAGLEPEVLAAAIEQNACRSGVIDLKLPKMMAGDYEPHFSLKHMFKDVQLGIHMANALDLEIPVTTVTAGVMYGAINQGWADLDFSVLFKNYAAGEVHAERGSLHHGGDPALVEESDLDLLPLPGALVETPEENGPALLHPENGQPQPLNRENDLPPIKDTVPSEAAARIIDAVLEHVGGDRAGASASSTERAGEFSPTGEALAPVSEPVEGAVKKEESKEPAALPDKDAKDAVESKNFVKRWFVARQRG